MRTLIIYSSKYGAAKEVAEQIKGGLEETCDVMSISKEQEIDLERYDRVLLGTSREIFKGELFRRISESFLYCTRVWRYS